MLYRKIQCVAELGDYMDILISGIVCLKTYFGQVDSYNYSRARIIFLKAIVNVFSALSWVYLKIKSLTLIREAIGFLFFLYFAIVLECGLYALLYLLISCFQLF